MNSGAYNTGRASVHTMAERKGHDVAVLFVHGVGDQSEGAILDDGIKALELAGGKIDATQPRTPEQASVLVPAERGRMMKVACLDGWWNHIVTDDAPKPLQAWFWAVLVLPYLVTHSGAVAMAAAEDRHSARTASDGVDGPSFRVASGILQSAYWRTCVVLPCAMAVLIAMVVPVTLEQFLARWRGAGSRVGPITRLVTHVVGDAWAYADSPVMSKVVAKLADQVAAARRLAPRVIVVGHSQGAALSQLLSAATRIDHLVTVGSGVALLGAARRRRWGRIMYGWAVFITYGWIVAWLLHAFATSAKELISTLFGFTSQIMTGVVLSRDPEQQSENLVEAVELFAQAVLSQLLDPFMIATLAFAAIGFLVLLFIRPDEPSADWGQPPVESWTDIGSIYDPVSVGGTTIEDQATRVAVVNAKRHSEIVKEHVLYFDNPEVAAVLKAVIVGSPVSSSAFANDPHPILRTSWLWLLPFTLALAYWGVWPQETAAWALEVLGRR